jgi:peptidoglycan-associated lipoprotein
MRICLTLIILLLGFSQCSDVNAQSRRLERADRAFDAGEYHEAIGLYRDAYSAINDRDLRTEIIFRIAKCYMKVSDIRQTEIWFRRAISRSYSDPEVYWYYGEALKMIENYEEAIENYKIFQSLVPDDPRAEIGIRSSMLAMQWLANPAPY